MSFWYSNCVEFGDVATGIMLTICLMIMLVIQLAG
jgi:hypothetical protein